MTETKDPTYYVMHTVNKTSRVTETQDNKEASEKVTELLTRGAELSDIKVVAGYEVYIKDTSQLVQ